MEQFALRMSPGSYFVYSVHKCGGEEGNSVNDNEAKKLLYFSCRSLALLSLFLSLSDLDVKL